jgi:hypothetical protein
MSGERHLDRLDKIRGRNGFVEQRLKIDCGLRPIDLNPIGSTGIKAPGRVLDLYHLPPEFLPIFVDFPRINRCGAQSNPVDWQPDHLKPIILKQSGNDGFTHGRKDNAKSKENNHHKQDG